MKGNGSAFSTDRGYLLIEGGELYSPKMTGDRYVDVSAYGQVVVTGAIAPDPDGAIEFQTTCSLSGDYEVAIDASGCSCLKVATGQDISELAVKVVNPVLLDANAPRDKYKILEGGYAGQFKLSQDFPKEKWGVRYDTDAAYLSPVKAFVIMLK